MSSNCPPQLQLSIQPNTTSFKRSFEQFGFDLGSPIDGGASGSNNRNDRNKRARSASSFSDSNESMDSLSSSRTLASTSSTPASSAQRQDGPTLGGVASVAGAGSLALPPRLPTPDIQDVEMIDYPTESRNSVASLVSQHTPQQSEERFRLSLERFNAFDSQIAILRRSGPTSPLTGSAAPLPRSRLSTPPILPPLDIPGEQPTLSLASSAIPFLPPPPDLSTPLTEVLFGEEGEVDEEESGEDETAVAGTSHSDEDAEIDVVQEFQARLSSALERLRPQSPLVPGLSLEEHEEDNHDLMNDTAEAEVDNHHDESGGLTPEPPTLPPIPSDANIVHFSLDDLLSRDVPDHTSSTVAEASNTSSLVSPTLGEHPLPSPILRDLHNWIDQRQSSTESASSSTPVTQNQLPPPPPPVTLPEQVSMGNRLTPVSDDYEGMDGNPLDRNSFDRLRRSGQLLDNLWERRSLELWNNPTDEAEEDTDYRPIAIPSRLTPSIGYSMDRPTRLEPSRRRVRINSSNSLVTESGLEARRRADHNDMIRPGPHTWWRREVEPFSSNEPTVEQGVGPSQRRSGLSSRVDAPYVLHLPPLPTPSLDDPPDDREEEERRVHELVTGSTSQVPRVRWYAPAASSAVRGVSGGDDWTQQRDEDALTRRSQLPSLSSASTLRQRIAAASSMHPQSVRPSSPLLSPLGNLDLEFFPNSDGGEGSRSSTIVNREPTAYQGQIFPHSVSIYHEERPPMTGPSNDIIRESARQQQRSAEEWQVRQDLIRQLPEARHRNPARMHHHQLISRLPASFEQRVNTEHPPSLPPPDFGTTFDGQDQGGLVAQFRDQYRQRARMSLGADDGVPSSVTANISSRPPILLRHIPQTTPHYSRYGAQNPPPVPSQPSMPSTSSYRPQSFSAEVTPEAGTLDWRHQTLIRLEENRQQLQALNERQRNLEAFFEGRAPRLEASNSAQPLALHEPDGPSSARTLPGTTGESHDISSIDLDGLNRRSLAPIPAVNVNATTAPNDVTEPSPPAAYHRYLFSEERVSEQPRNLPSYHPPSLDPEAFAPGPFRNTMAMQQQRLNRVLSHPQPPPSIPPLPFQDTNPAYPPYTTGSQSSSDEEAPRRSSLPSTSRPDPFNFGLRSRIPHINEDRTSRRTSASGLSSFPNYSATMNTSTSPDHRSSELHRYLTQHVRMEPSRLESPASPTQPSSSSSNGPLRSYPSASYIDPMRPNGHNSLRQLQLMQHRQQEIAERQRVALVNMRNYVDGSDADLSSNTSGPPATSRPFMSRFEPEGFASWRSRRRRHAGRSGGIGDFIHDDEFDDSYEGLLNLAATLGDAKPKSTPSDILEKLEKGTFQQWKTHDGDKRCPICLDDYTDSDKLLKLNNCTHWLHHDCLQQWLNTASTCPVCRESVQTPGSSGTASGLSLSSAPRRPYHRLQIFRRGPPQPPPGPGGNGPSDRDGPSSHGSGGWASAFRGFE